MLNVIEAIAALDAARAARGLVLVPAEPTFEMLKAGWRAEKEGHGTGNVFTAMLAARPKEGA